MMMERGHEQHSLATSFKAQDLQDDQNRLDDKHAADNRKKKLLLATDRNHSQRAADRKRSGVPHENPRRVTVKPEKSESSSGHRRTDDCQLRALTIIRKIKVSSNRHVARGISQNRIGRSGSDSATSS